MGHKVAMASDAAFPTSGRWSATGFTPASHNGMEHIVVTTVDATPPNLCGDGVVQVIHHTTFVFYLLCYLLHTTCYLLLCGDGVVEVSYRTTYA